MAPPRTGDDLVPWQKLALLLDSESCRFLPGAPLGRLEPGHDCHDRDPERGCPPRAGLPSRGPERAWGADSDGRLMIDRICASGSALLRPAGVLLMVHSGMCGPKGTVDRVTGAGLSAKITAKDTVPWGPALRSRRSWLERQGLASAAEDWEEFLVIRAQKG